MLVIVACCSGNFVACDTMAGSLAFGNGHRLEEKPINLDTIIAWRGLF
jgi:hypothetical protein